jgi:outer membrane protein OmpA-like peptidoglycan-associated protein
MKLFSMRKISLGFLIILVCIVYSYAQDKKDSEPKKNWEIGINLGIDNFTGEYNMYKESRWHHFNYWNGEADFGFGGLLKKNFSHVFALEGDWNYTRLTGKWKEAGTEPDFKTRVSELDLNSVWNINNLFSKNKFDRKIYWYAKLGAGASFVKDIVSMSAATAGPDWRKGGSARLTYDLGTGVAFRLNDKFDLNVGTQWSWIKTDRLDGKAEFIPPGGTHPTNGSITTKPGAIVADVFGTKLYTSIGLSYKFGKIKKKPAPVVEAPRPQPKPEPKSEPKPEPKPKPVPPPPTKPEVLGNVYKVYFAFDKYNLDNQAKADLDRLAKDMIDNPSVDLSVESHADCRGPASYNMKLSEKRGKSVIDYMVSKGVSASKISAKAYGESHPFNKCVDGVPCTNAEHAINRVTMSTITE